MNHPPTLVNSICHISIIKPSRGARIVAAFAKPGPPDMNSDLTLLVTSPGARLTGDLARQRPDWRLVALSDGPPREAVQGTLWGFVDWLGETMSGMSCRNASSLG